MCVCVCGSRCVQLYTCVTTDVSAFLCMCVVVVMCVHF